MDGGERVSGGGWFDKVAEGRVGERESKIDFYQKLNSYQTGVKGFQMSWLF